MTVARGIVSAAGIVVLLWFGWLVIDALLLLFLALVISIVLSAPVTWLEDRSWPRWAATLAVFAVLVAIIGLIGWMVVPRLADQVRELAANAPRYAAQFLRWAGDLLDNPDLETSLADSLKDPATWLPPLTTTLTKLGRSSMPVLTAVAAALVTLGVVIYTVAQPRPLLELYIRLFPVRHQPAAARAFSRASTMVVGWMRANFIAGAIEAVLAGVFLWFMGVSGALVWAALAFFSEFVPKLGPYIMATPPVLIALADDPWTAVWVLLFYVAMNEFMGDFVVPRVRASTMDLHPASVLAAMLLLAGAFGIVGALIATPIAAFIKAYYEEFYLSGRAQPGDIDAPIEAMLHRRERAE